MLDRTLEARIDAVRRMLMKHANVNASIGQFDELMECLRANDLPSQELADLLGSIVATWGHGIRDPAMAIMRAYIDIQLTREHVAAQEKMSAAADALQTASLSIARSSLLMNVTTAVIALVALFAAVLAIRH